MCPGWYRPPGCEPRSSPPPVGRNLIIRLFAEGEDGGGGLTQPGSFKRRERERENLLPSPREDGEPEPELDLIPGLLVPRQDYRSLGSSAVKWGPGIWFSLLFRAISLL